MHTMTEGPTSRIMDWTQLVVGLSVLVGLILVIYELRQAKDLAIAEVRNTGFISNLQLDASVMGEDFATTLSKIHSQDLTKLSDADLYRYDSYVLSKISSWQRIRELSVTGFYEHDWRLAINETNVCWYFHNPVGRAWLKGSFNEPHDEVLTLVREIAANCEGKNYIEIMRESLNIESSESDA